MDNRESKSLFHTAALLTFIIIGAKALGLLRDILIANAYGTTDAAVAYETASRLPSLLFDFLIGGVITAAFIPVFNRLLVRDGREKALSFAGAYVNLTLLLTAGIAALGCLLASPMISLLAPDLTPEVHILTVQLTRIMLPMVIFAGLAFSFVGILQSLGSFRTPAAISIASGVLMILYLLLLNDRFGIVGLSVTMLLGWVAQAAIQIPRLHSLGFRYSLRTPLRSPALSDAVSCALPMLIASWAQPVCTLINTRFASGIADGRAITALSYANKLYIILIGVLSFVATNLLFPKLSRAAAAKDQETATQLLRGSLKLLLFLGAPLAAAVLILAVPIVAFLFQHGEFTVADTALTSQALAVFSVAMLFSGVNEILTKALFAQRRLIQPMIVSLVSTGLNVLLAVLLADRMGIRGIALAVTASAALGAVLNLLLTLRLRIVSFSRHDWLDMGKSLLAAGLMGTLLWLIRLKIAVALPGWATFLICIVFCFPLYLLCIIPLRSDEIRTYRAWKKEKKKGSS